MINVKDRIKKFGSKILAALRFTKKLGRALFLDRVMSHPHTTKLLYSEFNVARLGKVENKFLKGVIDELNGVIIDGFTGF